MLRKYTGALTEWEGLLIGIQVQVGSQVDEDAQETSLGGTMVCVVTGIVNALEGPFANMEQ